MLMKTDEQALHITKQKQLVLKNKVKYRNESVAVKPSVKLRQKRISLPNAVNHNTSGHAGPKPGNNTIYNRKEVKELRHLDKLDKRVVRTENKLDVARKKLTAQKPRKLPGSVSNITKSLKHEIWVKIHSKIHELENDNLALEPVHRAELAAERLGRSTIRVIIRRIKSRPARRVRKWEKKNTKANIKLRFKRMAHENRELDSNAVKRYLRKRQLRKIYKKQAKASAKQAAAGTVKTATSVTRIFGRAVVHFVSRHPAVIFIAILCFLVFFIVQSCMGIMTAAGSGIGGFVGMSTYPSSDKDIYAAEAVYAGMETCLQYIIENYAMLHAGFDEYKFNSDVIKHDPYVLISILCVLHDGAWTLTDVQGTLDMLFYQQYSLEEDIFKEVRYRTIKTLYTDPGTGEIHEGSYEEPYDYFVCVVTLKNFDLSHLPVYIMDEDGLSHYALYMATLGNRPGLFPSHLYTHASTKLSYERYAIPPEYFGDEVFAAIINEAEKYLGMPYVWGGSTPKSSFDCSGFVSWVINHSGWDVGRLTAQGLYDACTPISPANAKPGDLIFFAGTYDTAGVSHVGIYVGDSMMLHCGNPIGYASTDTAYWQSKFYNYGRLP